MNAGVQGFLRLKVMRTSRATTPRERQELSSVLRKTQEAGLGVVGLSQSQEIPSNRKNPEPGQEENDCPRVMGVSPGALRKGRCHTGRIGGSAANEA